MSEAIDLGESNETNEQPQPFDPNSHDDEIRAILSGKQSEPKPEAETAPEVEGKPDEAAKPKEPEPEPEETASQRVLRRAAQERAKQEAREELAAQRRQFEQETEQARANIAQLEQLHETARNNPLELLAALGKQMGFESDAYLHQLHTAITAKLMGEDPSEHLPRQDASAAVKRELEQLKAQLAEREQREQEARQLEQDLRTIKEAVDLNQFSYLRQQTEATPEAVVYEVVQAHWNAQLEQGIREPTQLDLAEAATLADQYYQREVERELTRAKEVLQRYEQKSPAVNAKAETTKSKPGVVPSLTNADSSANGTPVPYIEDDEEAFKAAFFRGSSLS